MPKAKISDNGRRILAGHRRSLQRSLAAGAEERLSAAREALRKAGTTKSTVESLTTKNAVLTGLRGVITTVGSSWGVSVPLDLRSTWNNTVSASTNFTSITIAYPQRMVPQTMDDVDITVLRNLIADVKGIGYHEIGHCRFTTPFPTLYRLAGREGAIDSRLHQAWNILEDQRMENAVVADSPVIADYFTTMVLQHVIANPSGWSSAWVMLYGRYYLPSALRSRFRGDFRKTHGTDLLHDVEHVIGGYLAATDAKIMMARVDDFQEILASLPRLTDGVDKHNTPPEGPGNWRSDDDEEERIASSGGSPTPPSPEQESGDSTDESDDDADSEGGTGQAGDEEEGGDPQGTGQSGGEEDGEEDGEEGNQGSGTEGNDNNNGTEGNSKSPNSDGASSGSNLDGPLDKAIEQALNDALSKRSEDKGIDAAVRHINETANTQRIVLERNSRTTPMRGDGEVQRKAQILAEDIERALQIASADNEPVWQSRQTKGMLDPFQYRTKIGGSQEYRRRYADDGDLGFDISVVLALDVSGSMQGNEDALGACAYATKRACDALDIPCVVTTFNHDGELLLDRLDKPEFVTPTTSGGTNPITVMEALDEWTYDRTHQLVVIMTDGMFASFPGFSHYGDVHRYFLGIGFSASPTGGYLGQYMVETYGAHEGHEVFDLLEIPVIIGNFLSSFIR
jgi:hypothetical protein